MKLISIIIPVYNTEKYLTKCIESVVNQTYKNLEIILVNDGSTDNSGKMCDEWSKKDKRIKVLHKSNGGLMNAWKYGVVRSQGDYIGFVDSDDWIDADMYETLLNIALKDNVSMVLSGFVFENGTTQAKENIFLNGGYYSKKDILERVYPYMIRVGRIRGVSPNRVTKLFQRDLLLSVLDLCNERVSIGEDLLTTFSVMSRAESFTLLSDFHPYHYRTDNISMIRSYSDVKYQKLEILRESMLQVGEEYDYDFSQQLDMDFVALILEQMELEILFSGKSNAELKKSLRTRRDGLLSAAIKNVKYSGFSKKQKLYLFLIKHNLFSLMIFIRRLKKVK